MAPACDKCGRRLRFSRIVACLRQRKTLTYPSRDLNGGRTEQPVRWLCGGCTARADRYRAAAAGGEAGEVREQAETR